MTLERVTLSVGLPVYRDGVAPAPVPDRDQQKPSYSSGGEASARAIELYGSAAAVIMPSLLQVDATHASSSVAPPKPRQPIRGESAHPPISPGEDLMPDQRNRSQRARQRERPPSTLKARSACPRARSSSCSSGSSRCSVNSPAKPSAPSGSVRGDTHQVCARLHPNAINMGDHVLASIPTRRLPVQPTYIQQYLLSLVNSTSDALADRPSTQASTSTSPRQTSLPLAAPASARLVQHELPSLDSRDTTPAYTVVKLSSMEFASAPAADCLSSSGPTRNADASYCQGLDGSSKPMRTNKVRATSSAPRPAFTPRTSHEQPGEHPPWPFHEPSDLVVPISQCCPCTTPRGATSRARSASSAQKPRLAALSLIVPPDLSPTGLRIDSRSALGTSSPRNLLMRRRDYGVTLRQRDSRSSREGDCYLQTSDPAPVEPLAQRPHSQRSTRSHPAQETSGPIASSIPRRLADMGRKHRHSLTSPSRHQGGSSKGTKQLLYFMESAAAVQQQQRYHRRE